MPKIILSRKGFDSSVGGAPSPILEDGRMVSLPIPSAVDRLEYASLKLPGIGSYADLLRQLALDGAVSDRGAHADPDLIAVTRSRSAGWRPSLGQVGAAAGHLRNQRIGVGDLFLFYGWFRHVSRREERLVFSGDSGGFHAIFGFLRIAAVLQAGPNDRLPDWAEDHPHALSRRRSQANNSLYVGSSVHDAGVFYFRESLRLTKPGLSRSRWRLDPDLFRDTTISYHRDSAWREGHFRSYPRAQEYVIDATPAIRDWAEALIENSRQWA